jgi:GMP synthase (glutamine-hydrolysing)
MKQDQRTSAVNRVAILDAGGQYVDLVRKAVTRQGIPADVLPLGTPAQDLEGTYGAIIISGSPASSHAEAAPQPDAAVWDSQLPLLGICYGMQAMVVARGGEVAKNAIREDGRVTTQVDVSHPIFKGIKRDFTGLFTHGDFVKSIPEGFTILGSHVLSDGSTAYSSIAKGDKVGVQFHPEVFDDTPEGYQLFKNFLFGIAKLSIDESYQEARLAEIVTSKRSAIAEQVGDRHVIAFVSGGVDSSVAAMIASTEIPAEKFHAYYIDSGFMRDEDDLVIEALQAAGMPVQKIEAAEQFEQGTVEIDGQTVGPLMSVTDPEEKRKIIGKVFVQIQNQLVANLQLDEALLLQGTNAADRIESGHSTGDHNTQTIKSHHNQVKEVQELKAAGLLIEPIDDLFKDEVRELGRELGLPEALVQRQPFPGPGTAIRILCSDGTIPPDMKKLDEIHTQLLPIRSVGVGGDERSHLFVAAVEHGDYDANTLAKFGADLPAHHRDSVNRVVYALTPGAVDHYSLTETHLTADARNQLRLADKIVFEEMRSQDLLGKIAQFPVVLIPVSFTEPGKRSIVLRPVATSTFMTVQAMLPGRDLPDNFLKTIADRILLEVPGISQVLLDLTNKPPATTEWE